MFFFKTCTISHRKKTFIAYAKGESFNYIVIMQSLHNTFLPNTAIVKRISSNCLVSHLFMLYSFFSIAFHSLYFHVFFFSHPVAILLVYGPARVSASSECTPTSTSTLCERTSSCPLVFPAEVDVFRGVSLLSTVSYRYSLNYVQRVMNAFKSKVNEVELNISDIQSAWVSHCISIAVVVK